MHHPLVLFNYKNFKSKVILFYLKTVDFLCCKHVDMEIVTADQSLMRLKILYKN